MAERSESEDQREEERGTDEWRRQENDEDNIGLTSNGVAREISHYVNHRSSDEDQDRHDSSGDEDSVEENELEREEEDEFEEENQLAYELVDDDYEQQPQQSEEEEFGDFKEAEVALNGNGNGHHLEEDPGVESEGKNESSLPEGRMPSFPVNRSSIPPLTTGTESCLLVVFDLKTLSIFALHLFIAPSL
jgi:hypothetical protein